MHYCKFCGRPFGDVLAHACVFDFFTAIAAGRPVPDAPLEIIKEELARMARTRYRGAFDAMAAARTVVDAEMPS